LENLKAVKAIGAVPIIAVNPRRKGKEGKVSNAVFFGGRRYPVEQFNSHVKYNLLRDCWVRPRGMLKKTSMVMAGLVCMEANAIDALLRDDLSLKCASRYWD
jgi:hypothetical protein